MGHNKIKHAIPLILSILITSLFAGPQASYAVPVTFSGSSGSLSAQADFDIVGGQLKVTLTNTSPSDVLAPSDVLTAVFFDVNVGGVLTPVSAVLDSGSTVFYDPDGQPAGGVVGGEWAYLAGLVGAPGSATEGISSAGLSPLFGNANFPGANLAGATAVDGVQYGLLSTGDNTATGNGGITGSGGLIKKSVVFTLSGSGLPSSLSSGDISHVSFQYGTATTEPNVPPAGCTSNAQCDDSNSCTDDVCNIQSGLCSNTPNTNQCRASAGACDPAEFCSNGSCPADAKSTAVCRASAGICDVAESCDGTNNDCPANGFVAAGTECAAANGACDQNETCTGSSAACPADGPNLTSECRASAGICDVAEDCSDASDDCPANAFLPSSNVCRPAAGECDLAESCPGNGPACPADGFAPANTACSAGVCGAGVCEVIAVKFYTETNVNVGKILDNNGTPLNPSDDFLRDRTVAEANFGTPLSQDTNGKYVLKATLKNGIILNYNPGQYYAVTKVTLGSANALVNIIENFQACTSGNPHMSDVNPRKQPPGSALFLVVTPDGVVHDYSGAMAKSGDLTMAADFNSATGTRTGIPAGSMVYMYVKFAPGLIGTTYPLVAPECHNTETVTVTTGAGPSQAIPGADLILMRK